MSAAGVDLLYKTTLGEKGAYEKFRQSGVVRNAALLPAGTPDYEQLNAIGSYFGQQFKRVGFIQKEVQPDWDLYRVTHRELDVIQAKIAADINRLRVIMLVWLRAHQKMASGKSNPAA